MRKLELEVDLQHSPGEVTLRAYLVEGERRQLLRLQALFNLIHEVRRETSDFSPDDQAMLRQLWPHVNKMHLLQANLQVIKIAQPAMDRWLETWEHQPDRFIEKFSRLPFSLKVPEAKLHFELECHGETSKLSAIVTTPEGKQLPYFDVQHCRNAQRGEVLVQGRLMRLDLPIADDVLKQVFGSHNPTVPTNALLKHLPVLLENRLDLLRGPSVVHKEPKKKYKAELRLRCDGADVLITAKVGPIEIVSTKAPMPYGLERGKAGKFVVLQFQTKSWKEVQGFLGRLPLARDRQGWFRLSGESANMAKLHDALRTVPDTVQMTLDTELQRLLNTQAELVPQLSLREGDGWVDVDISCRVGDVELRYEELDQLSRSKGEFVRTRSGHWLRLPGSQLADFLQSLKRDNIDYGRHRKTRVEATALVKTISRIPDLRIPKSSQELADALRDQPDVEPIPLAPALAELLRPYQKEGAEFLYNRSGYGVGCILADDMGLGKTVQTLAFIDALRQQRAPEGKFLVVCPASVVSVWVKEAQRFTRELRVRALVGSPDQRREMLEHRGSWDVLVTNYAIVRNDFDRLQAVRFETVILDEAQQIKNPEAQITRCVKGLQTRHRVALTGTPLENRLLDLWSIVDFLVPGYLGDTDYFKVRYTETRQGREYLSRKMSPLMLRRTKDAVAPELPPRMEENLLLPLADSQNLVYQEALAEARNNVQQGGMMQILAALTKLRQICCHPRLIDKTGKNSYLESAKLDTLLEMLEELLEEGHSALVFSQFVGMLDIIEEKLKERDTTYFKIIGATPAPQRATIVDQFTNSPVPSVFLLSLRAAGTGLTLTKADYVFIYDPWWNPAVENQAIDRTHRIGQDKPVFAYRLIAEGTVEEKVIAMQDEKRQLFAEMVDGAAQLPAGLKVEDLLALLG
jgi:superfamily II DNA or RNA helicase